MAVFTDEHPMLRQIVGRLHVGEEDSAVCEYVLSRFKKEAREKMTGEELKELNTAVVAIHRQNQGVYNSVMRGM